MKFALCQTNIFWEDKMSNYKKAELLVKECKEEKADIVLFCEMSFTGFSMEINVTSESHFETIEVIRNMCMKYNVAIGFGWVRKAGEKAENHYSIIDANGKIILDYVKIHPFSYSGEDIKFCKGDAIQMCSLNDIKLSTLICYDLRFPMIFQAVSDKVDVIVVPANWPEQRSSHWKALLQARAIENMVYIMGVNCVGTINGMEYSGDSCIISPLGEIIDVLHRKEGIIYADIPIGVDKVRESFPVFKDRRNELYKRLLE